MNDDNAGVKFPPPLVYLAGIIVVYVLQAILPLPIFPGGATWILGVVVIMIGLIPPFVAARRMREVGTSLNPTMPSTAMVTDVPYNFTRNPMYLGLAIIMIGFGLLANSWWVVPLVVLVVFIIQSQVIQREEQYLERKFGDDYRRYKASVRRWL